MKKQIIREGTYETNSSSSHSLSLGVNNEKPFIFDTISPNKDGVVIIKSTKNFDNLRYYRTNNAKEKAAYLAARALKGFQDAVSIEVIKHVVLFVTGADKVIFDVEDCYPRCESFYMSDNVSTAEDVKSFIFDKNSWLIVMDDALEGTDKAFDLIHTPPYITKQKKVDVKKDIIITIDGFEKTFAVHQGYYESEFKNALDEILKSKGCMPTYYTRTEVTYVNYEEFTGEILRRLRDNKGSSYYDSQNNLLKDENYPKQKSKITIITP